jgi:DNA mismatch endonuclease, patch repair protein
VSPTKAVSHRMRAVRRKGTAPEIAIRKVLQTQGVSFRTNPPGVPGKPDLCSSLDRWAIFVHGCFWHGHSNCPNYSVPKSNTLFWARKVDQNRQRDLRKARQLRKRGWGVLTVWQCELSRNASVTSRILRWLDLRHRINVRKQSMQVGEKKRGNAKSKRSV